MSELVIVNLSAQRIESKIKEGSKAIGKVKFEANGLLTELREADKLYVIAGGAGLKSYEVRSLVGELRRIAYEAEDEVDNLLFQSTSLSLVYNCLGHQASKKLRELKEQTREVKFKLNRHAHGSNKKSVSCARGSQAPKGHLPADGDFVIGIDDEIKRVVHQLIDKSEPNDGQSPVKTLAIVGMGGSGKTTLARSIFNHRDVKKNFYFQAWVSVSQGWDTSTVLLDILKQIRGQKWIFSLPDNNDVENDPNKLVSRLNQLVCKKTCLLVLDDVWHLKSLHEFIDSLQGNDSDSGTYTIVITSRQNPANHINWWIHQPERLYDQDSWKLFSLVASNSSKPLSIEYRTLAMAMLKKCQGLPLAIVALGRLLKTKGTKREWHRVLSQITGTDATSMYGPVNEILGLSYDDLPNYLKPCFLYLGLFPEGYTISGGPLIRMWIAEGFIECKETGPTSDDKETLEVAGRRYLQELIDHTMVDVVTKTYTGKAKTIRLHDIMRDFCVSKAKELDFLTEPIEKTSRRAAINLSKRFALPANNSHLRSLAILGKSSTSPAPERYTSQENQRFLNLDRIHRMYKLLRVLDIIGIRSPDRTLPREIGNLIHLTYLRIRTTNIQQLPKSIGNLRNLLTLDYWDVTADKEVNVPNVLWKLERLRHLFLPNEMSDSNEDLKLHKLKDLITLWGVGGGNWTVKEMGKMRSELRKLFVHRISTEEQLNAVLSSPPMEKNSCLYALALDWYGFEFKNVNELSAKQSLQNLRLMGKAPDKSNDHEFPSNLGKLELYYTQLGRTETMALLGRLAVLKVLKLCKDSYIGDEWNCSKGSFPVLEELKLSNLPNLESWEMEEGAMPCLKKLSIVCCIKLKQIPEGLKLVRGLEKLDTQHMPHSFMTRLQSFKGLKEESAGEDHHIIKHIPQVSVWDSSTPSLY